ncbi:MAG: dienelactone hydrolase family protein [Phycisphaerae bacterium]|nr:dienelactone hydrolase family protein [Phycisphaerae bacterium]
MNRWLRLSFATTVLLFVSGCSIETILFPIFEEPFLLPEPPATLGPYAFEQRTITVDDLGDGRPGEVTVFAPLDAPADRPALVWVLGVNNRVHFHQSFHEYMASWGYVDLIAQTRDISFADTQYHAKNVANVVRTVERALSDEFALSIDAERVALGGYSVGGSMAAFAAAQTPAARAVAMWAPAPAPIWQGVDPEALLPAVAQPTLFLLAEFDIVVGDWPERMQQLLSQSSQTVSQIDGGVHLFFQQPPSLDDRNPATPITRQDQMREAFARTRAYLDQTMDVTRD